MGYSWSTAFMEYGAEWRAHRHFLHQDLHIKAVSKYRPQQIKATNTLLRRLYDSPDRWEDHLRQ